MTVKVVLNSIMAIKPKKHVSPKNFYILILQNDSWPVDWPAMDFFKKLPHREKPNDAFGGYLLGLQD